MLARVEPVPASPLASWHLPLGDAPHLERMAEVGVRQNLREGLGKAGSRLVAPLIAVLGLAMTFLVSLSGLAFVAAGAFLWWWQRYGAARQLVKAMHRLPTAHEPYTITLDAEGLHAVGESFADHLRWRVFSGALADDGLLVLRRRGSKVLQLLPLPPDGPASHPEWLAHEVDRLITADAPAATSPRSPA